MIRFLILAAFLSPSFDSALLGLAQDKQGTPSRQDAEKRFPPLQVPPGFKATLFACDPLIEYPSVIALGPKPRSVYVAYDYMTGLGTEIVRRDEIRLVEDADGDGFAEKSTFYAGGFNSIQGLLWHAGTVYVMHAPILTALRDVDGDGKADERKDLFKGLGWEPEKAPDRLHMANGIAAGHDGWLYLAMGDRGVDVARPEGDRLALNGGGILRCRPDGKSLHVFSTGLRNIYDVALDEELNVFVRDNENDGGTYKIRVCHSFFGADHGYPYLYEEHPDEAMAPLADIGLGSSAGGACYLEASYPPEYRGSLFFCEWGRSVVRYPRERSGASFASRKEVDFAAGASNDPYGFKPTDLFVDRDGALLVSDWCDGQRPKRGRGRIYRITSGDPVRATGLDSESYHERVAAQLELEARGDEGVKTVRQARLGPLGRMHAVWILARRAPQELPRLVESDPDPRVRAQAIRAMADLDEPAERIAALGKRQDPRVLLEVVIALGRRKWAGAPDWLREYLGTPDGALAHAAQQTLRASGNWPAVLGLLDLPDSHPLRPIALRAVAWQADPVVADGLIERLKNETDPRRRREDAFALARIYKKPAPWVYWGFRPAPRPPHATAWERTAAIEEALGGALGDAAVLRRMQREGVPPKPATLAAWLKKERDPEAVTAILDSLKAAPAESIREALEELIRETGHAAASRRAALEMLAVSAEDRLLDLAGTLEDGPVLAEALRHLGRRPRLEGAPLLRKKLGSTSPDARVAAVEALGELRVRDAAAEILERLADSDLRVRRASATALGKLGGASEPLLKLMSDPDSELRRRCLESLALLREPRAAAPALAGLKDRETEVAALRCLAEVGSPDHASAVADFAITNRSLEVLEAAVRALSKWKQDASLARVQGATGALLCWKAGNETVLAAGSESRVKLPAGSAASEFAVAEPVHVQFLASCSEPFEVLLNGRAVHRRAEKAPFRADSERFEADLPVGPGRIEIRLLSGGAAEFHARFRRKGSTAEHERLAQLALTTKGDVKRGREVYLNAKKSACVNCHRLGDQGGKIGPELTGVGRRFSKIYLVESLLEPSRAIAPSFQNWAVKLKDGRILSGVKVAETESSVTLGDTQAALHVLKKSDIEQEKALALSIMPEGLEKGLTPQEFVDLVAFLVDQK